MGHENRIGFVRRQGAAGPDGNGNASGTPWDYSSGPTFFMVGVHGGG